MADADAGPIYASGALELAAEDIEHVDSSTQYGR